MPYCEEDFVALLCGRAARVQRLGARRLLDGRLALLEALHHLVDDGLGRDLGRAERDVELVGLAEAHLADDVGEQRRAA